MRNLIFIFSFFFLSNLYAQSDSSAIVKDSLDEKWNFKTAEKTVKFSPLEVFSIIPTYGVDIEVKMIKQTSIQVGAAIIPSFIQILASDVFNSYDRMGGYKIRAEGRLYMPVHTNQYFSLGVSLRHLIIRNKEAFGMELSENEPWNQQFAYFKYADMVYHRFNSKFEIKYGFTQELKFLAFDYYVGLSMRNINVQTRSEIPEGGIITEQRGMWTLSDNYKLRYPTPIIGLKVGFKYKNKRNI